MSYFKHPAKNESITFFNSDSGFMSFNSWSTKMFEIEGWSTIMSKDNDPLLSVLLYVYIGSGLPINSVGANFGDDCSSKLKLYGGNHIILPPLGPLSQAGKSCTVKPGLFDVLQAKFSNESIYFLT